MQPSGARRTRRANAKPRPDGAKDKRFSSSLGLLLLSIQQYWLREIDPAYKSYPPMSLREFLTYSNFDKCHKAVLDIYQGVKGAPKVKHWGSMIDGTTNMKYYELRAIAGCINLNPASMLLLFSQFVGEERRAEREGKNRKEAVESLLSAIQRILTATKQYIERKADDDLLFMREYDHTENGYLPDVTVLKMWRDAYLEGPVPPDPINTRVASHS